MIISEFDELHVVSDLHLGGEKTPTENFQIFKHGKRLGDFIERLAKKANNNDNRRVALVLNGDIVDFLAETDPMYLDPSGAVEKLKRIYQDPSFNPVWKALELFVSTPNRYLIIILGNHDVELALPPVKNWLSQKLTKGVETASARITFATDGSGFCCNVGKKRVLCLHGNEVDEWNVVDYFQLLQVSRALNRDQKPLDWNANAGTRLVIDIMNSIKRNYPMVDLLKPEIEAASPIVLAFDPSQITKLPDVIKLGIRASKTKKRIDEGLLGAEPPQEEEEDEAVLANAQLEKLLKETFGDLAGGSSDDIADMLLRADKNNEENIDPRQIYDDDQQLGWVDDKFDSAVKWFRKISKMPDKTELLRRALKKLVKGNEFDLDGPDNGLDGLEDKVGKGVDYLITGHSHLARVKTRKNGKHYYNSGTWIRLIQLSDKVIDNADDFNALLKILKKPDIEALDIAEIPANDNKPQKLVKENTTLAVSIIKDKMETHGQLNLIQDNGKSEPVMGTKR